MAMDGSNPNLRTREVSELCVYATYLVLKCMESLTVTLGRKVKDGRLNTIFGVMGFAFICFVAADPENLAGHFSFLCLT